MQNGHQWQQHQSLPNRKSSASPACTSHWVSGVVSVVAAGGSGVDPKQGFRRTGQSRCAADCFISWSSKPTPCSWARLKPRQHSKRECHRDFCRGGGGSHLGTHCSYMSTWHVSESKASSGTQVCLVTLNIKDTHLTGHSHLAASCTTVLAQ